MLIPRQQRGCIVFQRPMDEPGFERREGGGRGDPKLDRGVDVLEMRSAGLGTLSILRQARWGQLQLPCQLLHHGGWRTLEVIQAEPEQPYGSALLGKSALIGYATMGLREEAVITAQGGDGRDIFLQQVGRKGDQADIIDIGEATPQHVTSRADWETFHGIVAILRPRVARAAGGFQAAMTR